MAAAKTSVPQVLLFVLQKMDAERCVEVSTAWRILDSVRKRYGLPGLRQRQYGLHCSFRERWPEEFWRICTCSI